MGKWVKRPLRSQRAGNLNSRVWPGTNSSLQLTAATYPRCAQEMLIKVTIVKLTIRFKFKSLSKDRISKLILIMRLSAFTEMNGVEGIFGEGGGGDLSNFAPQFRSTTS